MSVDFQRIVFFGDSLTDDGNLPEPVRPDPPYVGGRFTNGPVYAEVLARELGIASDNFALGGAEASTDASDPLPQRLINLSAQVDNYLAQQSPFGFFQWFGGRADPGTAASIFIGSNDFLNERPANQAEATDLVTRVVSDISDGVSTLYGAGVQHVLLYTLPDVSDAPQNQRFSASALEVADAAIAATNRGIKGVAAQASPLVETTVVDVNRLQAEIKADRTTFGLEVLDTPLYNKVGSRLIPTDVRSEYSANEVAFFDPLHPTKAVHGIIGAFSEATLEAERVVFRGGRDDVVVGRNLDDFVLSGRGEDRVSGRGGHDVLFAGAGDDRVDAGTGRDFVSGGSGDDVIRGRSNYDLLAGNDGADRLYGGSASDVIIGGAGGDQAFGESGNDFFFLTDDGLGNGFDQISGGTGTDTLRLTVSSTLYNSQAFRSELQEFATALDVAPGSAFTFDLLDLTVGSVERLEVVVRGRTVETIGENAPNPNQVLASFLRDADLWGVA
jgi:phospholipase/lecithinase/hemolysin